MATLYHFPTFHSLYPYKLFFLNQRKQQELKLCWYTQQNPPHKRCRFRAYATKKSRKVKDNAELCNEIREFIASVGLPESQVPTMKEFSQHGRSDLAYIVRRRGYKRIGELLASTSEIDSDGSILEKGETENKDAVGDPDVKDEEASVMSGGFSSSTEVSVVGNCSSSSVLHTNTDSDDNSHVPIEASADFSLREMTSYRRSLEGDDEKSYGIDEDGSLATEVSGMENHFSSSSTGAAFNSGNHNQEEKPFETSASFSLQETFLYSFEDDNERVYNMDDSCSLSTVITTENHLVSSNIGPAFNSDNHDQEKPSETSTNVSFGEKDLSGGDEVVNIAVESVDGLPVEGKLQNSQYEDTSLAKEVALETEVLITENDLSTSNIDPAFSPDDHSSVSVEGKILQNSQYKDKSMAKEVALEAEVPITENHLSSSNIDPDFSSDDHGSVPVEGKILQKSQYEDNSMAKEVALETEVPITENHLSSSNIHPAFSSDKDSSVPIELSALSLEEKVANFMQHGLLDTVEDNSYGKLNEDSAEEGKVSIECGHAEEVQSVTSTSEHLEDVLSGGNSAMTLNWSASKSTQLVPAVSGNHPLRDENLSAEGESTQSNEDLDIKTGKKENHVETSRLKFMLHQKELELSRLKEQIEKEKNALSVLQTRAETEISKAQKLISEKDAELQAAEETLSGLVEVQIQYRGDGEIVEVTGSFNGWHHCIKMDPESSSSTTDAVGSRKSKLWSTVLWLYPGKYEIKFIVDGHWKIDPDRETVTHGAISNNILQVEG